MNSENQSEEEYLKETAPILFGRKLKADDAPPPGYAAAFSTKIRARIANEFPGKEPEQAKVRYINYRNFAAAAAALILIAGITAVQYLGGVTEADPTYIGYTDEEAEILIEWYGQEWYEEANYADIDEETFFARLDLYPEADAADLENYLMEEGISYELILNEINDSQQ